MLLHINPKLLKRYKLNRLTKSINNNRMKSIKYGSAFVVDVKKTGLLLDGIIPMTFGFITWSLLKVFGNKELMRFSW